mmetsp:Transcript_19856/g.17550  ORF Transcript_19856/g.17550 Transcript_19856/m.17550 type:complete len:95 (-) Transcript_19856:157-441(-)
MTDFRKDFIKTSFKGILDNIISNESRCFHALFSTHSMSEVIRKIKTKKRQAKFFDKNKDEITNFFFDQDWSQNLLKFLIEERKELWGYNKTISL